MLNAATYLRRELLIRLVRAFDAGTLLEEIDRIPVKLRPKDGDPSRCCVYHDRAVIKYRLMAFLGISAEDETDEAKTLKEYLGEVIDENRGREESNVYERRVAPISVCGPACSGCPDSKVVSTSNCRGCLARPCLYSCPKNAITVTGGQSVIDHSKCIKCGKCITACPYHAIIKTTVPCEEACPVGAIRKNEHGIAEIDFRRCIFCGKCFMACPFGAIMERSQIIDILSAMKRGEKLLAACVKVGFSDVIEVALGAEKTTSHETAEFLERMERDPKTLMTTSCCPAYVNLVGKHIPELVEHVSLTPSPMVYAHEMVREADPSVKTVFIGPCVAKRSEAKRKGVDFVLSFEELGALLAGRKVDILACEPHPVKRAAATSARNFAKSCGVTEAVLAEAMEKIPGFKLESKQFNGIDRKTIGLLRLHALGKLPGNFIEVMACPGGCVNGPCSLKK